MKLAQGIGGGEGRIPLSAKGGVNGDGRGITLTLKCGVGSRINNRLFIVFIEWCIGRFYMKLLLQMGIGEGRIPLSAKGGVNGGCKGHNIDTEMLSWIKD